MPLQTNSLKRPDVSGLDGSRNLGQKSEKGELLQITKIEMANEKAMGASIN